MKKLINLENPKHREVVQNFLNSHHILIIDPSKKMRSTVKRILAELGLMGKGIHFTNTFEEGEPFLEKGEADFVFSSYRDEENTCEELIKKHIYHYPDRRKSGFFLFCHEDYISYANALYLDYELDAYFSTPFSAGTLRDGILTSFSNKLLPTKYESQIYLGLDLYNQNHSDFALDVFDKACALSKAPGEAYAYMGKCYQQLKKSDKAQECYEKSVYYQLDNYLALNKLMEISTAKQDWKKAYEYQLALMENHPFNPRLLPRMMVIALRNECYEDIYELAMSFSRLPIKDEQVQKHVSAGLVMSGRHFIKSKTDPETGKKILLKASDLSNGRIEIIRNVCFGLLEGNFFEEAYNLLGEYMEFHDNSHEIQILELEFLSRTSKDSKTLLLGMDLIKKGIVSQSVYDITVRTAIKLGRSITIIEDLVTEACETYPEKASHFLHLLESYRVKSN